MNAHSSEHRPGIAQKNLKNPNSQSSVQWASQFTLFNYGVKTQMCYQNPLVFPSTAELPVSKRLFLPMGGNGSWGKEDD